MYHFFFTKKTKTSVKFPFFLFFLKQRKTNRFSFKNKVFDIGSLYYLVDSMDTILFQFFQFYFFKKNSKKI
jgi:hypothetical protein